MEVAGQCTKRGRERAEGTKARYHVLESPYLANPHIRRLRIYKQWQYQSLKQEGMKP